MMAILRKKLRQNYTVVANEIIRDATLTWKARGILQYLLHLPEDWEIHLQEIAKHSVDGYASFMSGIKELREKGYFKTTKENSANGVIYSHNVSDTRGYFLKDEDSPVAILASGKPASETPLRETRSGKPAAGNRDLLSTNQLITNELSTDSQITEIIGGGDDDEQINQRAREADHHAVIAKAKEVFGGNLNNVQLETMERLYNKYQSSPGLLMNAIHKMAKNGTANFTYLQKTAETLLNEENAMLATISTE
ncbi:hypothetical protein ESZ50_04910 [Weissella muntiaci]|uniref:DnaB/C C-terminal domain-containing protein n=1 Tax=Weissella muntiaci TaxID=2508881 RepID=A0A6C2C918_9LACO|nr:DnaD domain protein [Weissella muntiaci]TYC49933.1 hypothetical protein ESZ50_04910 [Weissella muntiaci]